MENIIDKTIGEMVAEDYRLAKVFKKYRIDFCCRGNRSLQEVANKNNLEIEILQRDLEAVQQENNTDSGMNFKSWPLDLVTDYIEKKHHRYVTQTIPVLQLYLKKLSRVHGERHPELFVIEEHFNASAEELAKHMKKEEQILFPWIRKMVQAQQNQDVLETPHFNSVQNPITCMMQEHDNEGERFREIAKQSNNYTPPSDACNTYKVAYALLQEFEEDLHRHIHLENNILFPKAKTMEEVLNYEQPS